MTILATNIQYASRRKTGIYSRTERIAENERQPCLDVLGKYIMLKIASMSWVVFIRGLLS